MKIYTVAIIIFCILSFHTEASDKTKTDQDRINDIHKIAQIMEDFKETFGEYPFSENWRNVPKGMFAAPILCNLSHHELPERYRWPPPGTTGHMMTADKFESYLSDVLKKEIILPKDDRPVELMGKHKPFFYQFLFDGKNYFIATYFTKKLPYSRRINDNWYKYEVGSIDLPNRKIRRFKDIK